MPITYLDESVTAQAQPRRKITYLDSPEATPKSANPILPKAEQVEQQIAKRSDAFDVLMKEYQTPYDAKHPVKSALKPAVTMLKTAAVPFKRGEAAIASAGLAMQRGDLVNAGRDFLKGLSGQRPAELGDIIRTTGVGGSFNEALAAPIGFLGMAGLSNLATKGALVGKTNKIIAEKRPQIMNDKWILRQAEKGQDVVQGIDDALGNAYDDIYSKVNNFGVDANKMDDILLNSQLDDIVIKDIDTLVPGRIDTVEKARAVMGILRKRTPQSFFLQGGTTGKGGITNPKIRQINTSKAIKDVISDAVGDVDPEVGASLKKLDTFAHDKVYPTMDKLRTVFGRKEIANTEGIATTYNIRAIGKAAQRETIRGTAKLAREFKQYMARNYDSDLQNLFNNSRQLARDMGKFRQRQLLKWVVAPGAIGFGIGNAILNKTTRD